MDRHDRTGKSPSVLMPFTALLSAALASTMVGCGGANGSDAVACQVNRVQEAALAASPSGRTVSDRYIVKLSRPEGLAAVAAAGGGASGDPGAEYVRDLFRQAAPHAMGAVVREGQSEGQGEARSGEPEVRSLRHSTYSVRLPSETGVAETLESVGADPGVEYVEPDHKIHLIGDVELSEEDVAREASRSPASDAPEAAEPEPVEPDVGEAASAADLLDPLADRQWAHRKIGSMGAWQITPGSRKITVAVIDTGVDYTHPDLKANMWKNPDEIPGNGKDDDGNGYVDDVYGWDFANDDNSPLSNDGRSFHGTHVAGTIGAVGGNHVGVTGHSPYVRIMALKFIGANGGYTSDAVRAINYALDKGARILNNSWGSGSVSQALQEAISRAKSKGVLFVAAAGNSGNNIASRPMYPAAYGHDNILVVGATDSNDRMPSWSNYSVERVDVGAPGSRIYSTKNDGQYAYLQGTSMATPLVSGVAALIASIRPDYGYAKIKSAILGTVDKAPGLTNRVATGGRVNAKRAIEAAAKGAKIPRLVGGGAEDGEDPCAGL